MTRLNIKGMSFALGTTWAVLYAACVFIMLTVPKEAVVRFFNSIMHGWDVSTIMRWDISWWEVALGTVEIFILGWLVGVLFAIVYNLGASTKE